VNLVLLPVLLPLASALLAVLLAGRPRGQAATSLVGVALTLGASLLLLDRVWPGGEATLMVGQWPAPYGIAFAADGLGAALAAVAALLVLATLLAQGRAGAEGSSMPGVHPLVHLLLAGVNGAFLTADLFNLYVWFELMLMAALGLLAAGGQRAHLESAFKYFALNMLGTLLLLTSVALIYGVTGQLNYEALGQAAGRPELAGPLSAYLGVLVLALLMKAAAFPLFAWLPATYHSLPSPLLALFGGLLTKVGVYALLRLLGDVFRDLPGLPVELLGGIALATMVSGVLGAAYHWDLRRILAFHIVSQIGYLLLGIALMSPAGAAATLFFTLHNILVKAALFLIAGQIWLRAGHFDLRRAGGLYPARTGLALLFLVAAFSLVGLPPTSGFWGKFLLVSEAFHQGRYVWGGVALAVGALTLYSMVKIWQEAFWKPHPGGSEGVNGAAASLPAYGAIGLLLGVSLLMGLWPEPFIAGIQAATVGFGRGVLP
jgi:multicomponent Na+:H+ antiporter subunit D